MNRYALWALYFIPALAVEIICWVTNPIACLFVRKEPRHDIVKRLGKQYATFDREYLWGIFSLWATHDNAVDAVSYTHLSLCQLQQSNMALIQVI